MLYLVCILKTENTGEVENDGHRRCCLAICRSCPEVPAVERNQASPRRRNACALRNSFSRRLRPQENSTGEARRRLLRPRGRTGETYQINSICPFKVVSREDDDHYHATGWLDRALRHVCLGATQQKKSRDLLIEEIRREIERSIPLAPIQLTLDGNFLREYPPSHGGFVDHTKDDRKISDCVGVHMFCNGFMDRHRTTKTQDAIVCRSCSLRVCFPNNVKTYGELRQALSTQQIPA
ncbi:MAG: hypothetical protein CEN89_442 [Candidatus Berkelbacteria bacterium Licking1014_7]|uniref:Uncharacterized protein n=1 Tax=Candidatus Berkelbacteria bacterium Licking1014_7 TaxID=2017147 RepID=A0A554LIX7_9BACT|nr:MAG: hypothetical protein CEN89_442 [Candidatus Berkelbacteria bacterium Licking1014_7]